MIGLIATMMAHYIYYYNNSMKNCENEYYYISMEDREKKQTI